MIGKYLTAAALALVCCQSVSVFAAETGQAPMLAERHVQRGAVCTSCHTKGDVTIAPHKAECLMCHGGSYEAMKEKTKDVVPNPHYNHYMDKDCSSCHKGHKPAELTCDRCHKFNLKMKN